MNAICDITKFGTSLGTLLWWFYLFHDKNRNVVLCDCVEGDLLGKTLDGNGFNIKIKCVQSVYLFSRI